MERYEADVEAGADAQNVKLAEDHSSAGRHADAVDVWSHVLVLNPTFASAYRFRALSLFQLGELEKCVSDCSRGLALLLEAGDYVNRQTKARFLSLRGAARARLGSLRDAQSDYEAALKSDDSGCRDATALREDLDRISRRISADKHAAEGTRLYGESDLQNAVKSYSEALSLTPEDRLLFSNRAACWLGLEKYGACVIDSTKAIDEIETLLSEGNEGDAVLKEWLKLTLVRRGTAYCKLKKLSEGKNDLERAAQIVIPGKEEDEYYLNESIKLEEDILEIERCLSA